MIHDYPMLALELVAAFALSPLLVGVVNKTKAKFAGRQGASVLQLYYDLAKLLKKSSPRSTSSTFLFDLAPMIALVATMMSAFFILGGANAILLFFGFYLLGTARFVSVLAARDVASAFPDMGSAREVQFSALVEAIVFAILAYLAVRGEGASVSVALAAAAAFVALLSEN